MALSAIYLIRILMAWRIHAPVIVPIVDGVVVGRRLAVVRGQAPGRDATRRREKYYRRKNEWWGDVTRPVTSLKRRLLKRACPGHFEATKTVALSSSFIY